MGRINLAALRVRRRALANLQTNMDKKSRPIWLEVTSDIPPAQVLIRKQAQRHSLIEVRTKTIAPAPDATLLPTSPNGPPPKPRTQQVTQAKRNPDRSSRYSHFQPRPIEYEEDALRARFYADHPWELARPRVVLEHSGASHARADWSTGLLQPGIPLSGESVVQRQLHLLQHEPDISVSAAYDRARKEFYDHRRQEDVRRRIAAEEAQATGATFGPGVMQWGMQVENRQYDNWEKWSREQVVIQQQRQAAFAGNAMAVAVEAGEEEEGAGAVAVDRSGADAGRDGNGQAVSQRAGGKLFAEQATRRGGQVGRKVIE